MTTTRRLAAILAADVVGYSRLMGADEDGTLRRLVEIQRAVIDPAVAQSGGRIVKTTGDGFLIEFPSAVEAVRCALEIQEQVQKHEADCASERRFQFRIGINVGDVIASDNDIHGDGVNVAARLEALAEPGGILVSATVHGTAANRLPCSFDDLGERSLKNIEKPVRVYGISATKDMPKRPSLPLPDKPSIAVLPFQNMSGDPEQEYFADGIVEEIITGLSRVRSFFVIARNSSFTYKGRAVDVKQVGRELGVRYVLEGSVRKAGNRVRITGQLIEAATGTHLWADRFDGALEDVFDLQDQVTGRVVASIAPSIQAAEIERARRTPPDSLQAYDYFLRAQPFFGTTDRETHAEADRLLRRAIELAPTFARALALLARFVWSALQTDVRRDFESACSEIVNLTQRALSCGGDDPDVLAMCSLLMGLPGHDLRGGIKLAEKALILNPSAVHALAMAGVMHGYAGELEKTVEYVARARSLNPFDRATARNMGLVVANFAVGKYEDSLEATAEVMRDSHHHTSWQAAQFRIANLSLVRRAEEARELAERQLQLRSHLTVTFARKMTDFFTKPGVIDNFCSGLTLAGIPE